MPLHSGNYWALLALVDEWLAWKKLTLVSIPTIHDTGFTCGGMLSQVLLQVFFFNEYIVKSS
jgi:hypothetical protein